jgi:hypothetical protein
MLDLLITVIRLVGLAKTRQGGDLSGQQITTSGRLAG